MQTQNILKNWLFYRSKKFLGEKVLLGTFRFLENTISFSQDNKNTHFFNWRTSLILIVQDLFEITSLKIWKHFFFPLWMILFSVFRTFGLLKWPRGVPRKRCSKNMPQIYRQTPMPKCDFSKVALQETPMPTPNTQLLLNDSELTW